MRDDRMPVEPERYEIHIEGHLDGRWSAWFAGLTVTAEPGGETLLAGALPDQAALHGVLARIRDLGLIIVSVRRLPAGAGVRSKEVTMRRFVRYFWGTLVHPGATFEALAAEKSVRWAVLASCLPVLQVWGNIALHAATGFDWLGTRGILADPTFVGFFGQVHIDLAHWLPVFAALMPLLALLGLALTPGTAHLLSKLWGGQGSFEAMVNALVFASVVPNMVIGASSEWLFSVPMNLLTGHRYWWTAAMQGQFGPLVGTMWNVYVIGVYAAGAWLWSIALGAVAIRRIQRIPAWAAVLTMLVAFAVTMFIDATFVR